MRSVSITYGEGGAIQGEPNAKDVPAGLAAANIVAYEEEELPDLRPTLECRDEDGTLLTPGRVYEAKESGHITHRYAGEKTPTLRISCPRAEHWTATCREHVVSEVTGSMTREQVDAAAKAWRVYHRKAPAKGEHAGHGGYLVDHFTGVFLMNPQGEFVQVFTSGLTPDEAARQIRAAMKA